MSNDTGWIEPQGRPVDSAPDASAVQPFEDYWGTDEKHDFYMPDKRQYVTFKVMTEGDKAKFQKQTKQTFNIRQGGDASMSVDAATERHALIMSSVVDWNLHRQGVAQRFNEKALREWMAVAPPKIIQDLEFAIRKANPWMQDEMTTVAIDEEIDRLRELREQVAAREAGEAYSASK